MKYTCPHCDLSVARENSFFRHLKNYHENISRNIKTNGACVRNDAVELSKEKKNIRHVSNLGTLKQKKDIKKEANATKRKASVNSINIDSFSTEKCSRSNMIDQQTLQQTKKRKSSTSVNDNISLPTSTISTLSMKGYFLNDSSSEKENRNTRNMRNSKRKTIPIASSPKTASSEASVSAIKTIKPPKNNAEVNMESLVELSAEDGARAEMDGCSECKKSRRDVGHIYVSVQAKTGKKRTKSQVEDSKLESPNEKPKSKLPFELYPASDRIIDYETYRQSKAKIVSMWVDYTLGNDPMLSSGTVPTKDAPKASVSKNVDYITVDNLIEFERNVQALLKPPVSTSKTKVALTSRNTSSNNLCSLNTLCKPHFSIDYYNTKKNHSKLTSLELKTQIIEIRRNLSQLYKRLIWYCEACKSIHLLTSNTILCPFNKKHGFRIVDVPADGDCFYRCVVECLLDYADFENDETGCTGIRTVDGKDFVLSVSLLREWVAQQCGSEQLEFYKIQAMACPHDGHLDFIRPLLKLEATNSNAKNSKKIKTKAKSIDSACTNSIPVEAKEPKCEAIAEPSGSQVAITPPARKSFNSGVRRGSFPLLSTILSAIPIVSSLTGFHAPSTALHTDSLWRSNDLQVEDESAAMDATQNLKGDGVGKMVLKCGESAGGSSGASERALDVEGTSTNLTEPSNVMNNALIEAKPSLIESNFNQRTSRRVRGLGVRAKPSVFNLEELQNYIRLEGGVVGHSNSMWADNFAYMVIGDKLKLTILLIDMERMKSCIPYRYLHKYELKEGEVEDEVRYIILKRTGPAGHFQYVQQYLNCGTHSCVNSPRSPRTNSSNSVTNNNPPLYKACFYAQELPDVFKSLWDLEINK